MEKKSLFVADYFIMKCLTMFECRKKDIQKFILLLRNGVMCYECIDSWEKYNETSLPLKEKFFSKLKKHIRWRPQTCTIIITWKFSWE